jgi:glucosamine-6-phosphate deaminase
VTVSETAEVAGQHAAAAGADAIVTAQRQGPLARVVFASAPSQEPFLMALRADPRIDWARVQSFHMDEYLGLRSGSPQAFGQWLADRLPAEALARLERIDPTGDRAQEAKRYAGLLASARIDLTCMGIGVNGHVAFNEPGSAFDDDRLVRTVELAEASRQQQVDEGLFRSLDDVPTQALTLTIPALLSARTVVATVLGTHKARALADAMTGPIAPSCPASVLRTHDDVSVHVDAAAASLLPDHTAA